MGHYVVDTLFHTMSLHPWLECHVIRIVRVLWHAQVIGSSSLLVVEATTSSSFIDQFSSWCVWAGCPSPPGVDHSTTAGTRRTWWTLNARTTTLARLSILAISACSSRGTSQSITTVSTFQQFNGGAGVSILISTCCVTKLSVPLSTR